MGKINIGGGIQANFNKRATARPIGAPTGGVPVTLKVTPKGQTMKAKIPTPPWPDVKPVIGTPAKSTGTR